MWWSEYNANKRICVLIPDKSTRTCVGLQERNDQMRKTVEVTRAKAKKRITRGSIEQTRQETKTRAFNGGIERFRLGFWRALNFLGSHGKCNRELVFDATLKAEPVQDSLECTDLKSFSRNCSSVKISFAERKEMHSIIRMKIVVTLRFHGTSTR